MKSILLLLTFSILFNIQTNAQRDRQGNGRGQESGRIERIDNSQDRRNKLIPPERRKIETTKKPEVKQTQRPIIDHYNPPVQETVIVDCPEKTPVCSVIIDNFHRPPSYEEMAIDCFESGNLGAALINVEQAIKSDLFNPDLYFLRGKIYFELNDYLLAKRDFSIVLALNPEYADAYYYQGMCNLYLGDKKQAIEDFEAAASLGDTDAERFLFDYLN